MQIFMKTIFSSISRLFFAYSKFIVMITILSSLGTTHASEVKFLKCDEKKYLPQEIYIDSNYNIRTKKFKF